MKKLVLFVAVAGISALMAAPAGGPAGGRPSAPGVQSVRGVRGDGDTVRVGRKPGRGAGRARGRVGGKDEKLVDAIYDAGSLEALRRYSPQVWRASAEAREAYVDALSDHGAVALPDVAAFMADPSVDVANAAFDAWKGLLDEVDARRRVHAIVQSAAMLQQNGGAQHGPLGGVMQPGMPPPPAR